MSFRSNGTKAPVDEEAAAPPIREGTVMAGPGVIARLRGNYARTANWDKMYYKSSKWEGTMRSESTLIELLSSDNEERTKGVCIIQGITDNGIQSLDKELRDHSVCDNFMDFAKRHRNQFVQREKSKDSDDEVFISGNYHYHAWKEYLRTNPSSESLRAIRNSAHIDCGPGRRSSWPTHLSYRRITPFTYVFLVEPLDDPNHGPLEPKYSGLVSLWAHFDGSGRGLWLPQLYSMPSHDLFMSLTSIFQYPWHFELLFHDPQEVIKDAEAEEERVNAGSHSPTPDRRKSSPAIRPIGSGAPFMLGREVANFGSMSSREKVAEAPTLFDMPTYTVLPAKAMLYMMANSLWDTNLRLLDSEIQHVSFRDLRHPTTQINDLLHDFREALEYLHNSTREAVERNSESESLSQDFSKVQSYFKRNGINVHNPVEYLNITHKEAEDVQKFLMESFQLLMSSISMQETRLSAEQASRTTILTWLAILYLPLTTATGVFGMNISEINGGVPDYKWVLKVMGILLGSTIGVYVILIYVRDVQKSKEKGLRRLVPMRKHGAK